MQGDFGMNWLEVDWRLDPMVTQEVTSRSRSMDVQRDIWMPRWDLRCRLADVSSGDFLNQV